MATRIKAKADADGIIRVKCGDDILEIDTSDDWIYNPPVHFVPNPLDDFHTFHTIEGSLGSGDIDKIVVQLRAIHDDPLRQDPQVVAVAAPAGLDVHGVAALAHKIEDVLPNAMLAFDLGDLRKP